MGKAQILKSISFILLLFLSSGFLYSHTIKVSGKISTANEPVKNAAIVITNQTDSLQSFSTLTDSLGNYELYITITSVNGNEPGVPTNFILEQNYPNPFSAQTNITYSLNEPSDIYINIYDILGQEVKRFSLGSQGTGIHGVTWDGTDIFNRKVSPGIYFYQMFSGKETIVKKMIFSRSDHSTFSSLNPDKVLLNKPLKKDGSFSESIYYDLRILNSSAAEPQIRDTLIRNITFSSDTVMDYSVSELETEKSVNISGTVSAGSRIIQNAEVIFTNITDTTKVFITATDTSGNYYLTLNHFTGDSLFKAEIVNSTHTTPEIYNEIFSSVNLQNDTTINFNIESVGPWRKIKRDIPTGLSDLDFPDSLNGWVVGFYGILNTTDGGESWNEQSYPLEDHLTQVDFVDNKNGWICSNESSILKTTDGGSTWNVIFHDDSGTFPDLYDIQFLNKEVGFIVGGNNYPNLKQLLMRTTDGGETWTKIITENLYPLTHISIVNEQNIWISGYGNILFSSDTGVMWTAKNENLQAFWINNIQFIDEKYGFISCDDNEPRPYQFNRTTDGGNTWTPGPMDIYLVLGVRTMCFTDSLNGWMGLILSFGQMAIINTLDGGRTWDFLPDDTILSGVQSIYFINKHLGWAIGWEPKRDSGVILRYYK